MDPINSWSDQSSFDWQWLTANFYISSFFQIQFQIEYFRHQLKTTFR